MNPFQKRAENAAKILACYSNVADCIPQPIKKAEEIKPLSHAVTTKKVTKGELLKAEQNLNEALAIVKSGKKSRNEKRELAKKIVCQAFDDGLIKEEEFLNAINKLDK